MADAAAFAVLAAVAAVAIATFRDFGLGWDDFTHAQYGDMLLAYYASGFADKRALTFVNLYMYGGGFDMAAALAAKILPFDIFETRRLLGAVVGLVGLAATWRIARRLGGPAAGLIALLLLATCPLFYGHMFINAKDAPFAVAMTVLLLGLVRGAEEYPRLMLPTGLLLAFGFGLAIGTRIVGVFGVLYAAAALAVLFALDARTLGVRTATRRLGRFMLTALPAALLAYALMALIWPWSAADPLNPFRAVFYFSEFFEKPWKELFEGGLVSVPDMPRSYLPTLIALKLPEFMLALGLAGMAGAAVVVFRPAEPPARRASAIALILAALLPVVITMVERPAVYNGIRHFLFVVPPFAVLGGLAGVRLAAWAVARGRPLSAAVMVVFAAGFISPVIQLVRLHPYQYTHFNHIAGGVHGADDRFMLDYWGLAFKQASQQLRAILEERKEQPRGRKRWRVAVCGPHPPAEVALGPQFVLTWDPKGADFAMMLGEFYCATLDAPVLVNIEREDVSYARVYDIRGRNIMSLFTVAPVEREKN